jgi:hypothetical protein
MDDDDISINIFDPIEEEKKKKEELRKKVKEPPKRKIEETKPIKKVIEPPKVEEKQPKKVKTGEIVEIDKIKQDSRLFGTVDSAVDPVLLFGENPQTFEDFKLEPTLIASLQGFSLFSCALLFKFLSNHFNIRSIVAGRSI